MPVCSCGRELKTITKSHLNGNYHKEALNELIILKKNNDDMNIQKRKEPDMSVLVSAPLNNKPYINTIDNSLEEKLNNSLTLKERENKCFAECLKEARGSDFETIKDVLVDIILSYNFTEDRTKRCILNRIKNYYTKRDLALSLFNYDDEKSDMTTTIFNAVEYFNGKHVKMIIDYGVDILGIKEDVVDDLKNLLKNSKKPYKEFGDTVYKKIQYKFKSNRFHSGSEMGGQRLMREVRSLIYSNEYVDVDLVNAHPSIVYNLCSHADIDVYYLERYVQNRDAFINDVITECAGKTDKGAVKSAVCALINGGSNYIPESPLMCCLSNELREVLPLLLDDYDFNDYRTKLNNLWCEWENILISEALLVFKKHKLIKEVKIGRDKYYDCVLCFDGFMFRFDRIKPDITKALNEVNDMFLNKFNFIIKLVEKPFDKTLKERFEKLKVKVSNLNLSTFDEFKTTIYGKISDVSEYEDLILERAFKFNQAPITCDELADILCYVEKGNLWFKADGNAYYFNSNRWLEYEPNAIMVIIGRRLKDLLIDLNEKIKNIPEFNEYNIIQCLNKTIHALGTVKFRRDVVVSANSSCMPLYLKNDLFDTDNYLIGFENGYYNVLDNTFNPYNKDVLIINTTGYDYEEPTNEDIKKFEKYAREIIINEEEHDFIFEMISTGLIGRRMPYFIIFTGSGSNGKNNLFSVLRTTLGPDLCYKTNKAILSEQARTGGNPEMFNINKKRLVYLDEPSAKVYLKCDVIKEITGDDYLSVRNLYQSKIQKVSMNLTPFLLCNEPPLFDTTDGGLARRLIMYKFNSKFVKQEDYDEWIANGKPGEIRFLGNPLYDEKDFYLSMVKGCFGYLLRYLNRFINRGFQIPPIPLSLKNSTNEHLENSNDIVRWFTDVYERVDGEFVKLNDVYDNFKYSDMYRDCNKIEKRRLTKKNMTNDLIKSPTIYKHYYERKKIDGADCRNILYGFRLKAPTVENDV